MTIRQNRHLTFRGNAGAGRHGWLRLTPAYSYRMAEVALADAVPGEVALDPFAGTGTTGLAAARRGMRAILLDVNPFLAWLARVKRRNYSESEIRAARNRARDATAAASSANGGDPFIPPIHRIERCVERGFARGRRAPHDVRPRWRDRRYSHLAAIRQPHELHTRDAPLHVLARLP